MARLILFNKPYDVLMKANVNGCFLIKRELGPREVAIVAALVSHLAVGMCHCCSAVC